MQKISPTHQYSSNHLAQIKPYKGRKKFELYVHNQAFRSLLCKAEFKLPTEALANTRTFSKKIVFKEKAYGQLLQSIFLFIEKELAKKQSLAAIQNSIVAVIENIVVEFKIVEVDKEASVAECERLVKAYQRAEKFFSDLADETTTSS